MVTLIFWDVQHGHAVYLKTENQHMVFDLGTGSYGSSGSEFSPLRHLRHKYSVTQLDAVVITHPHSDHLYDINNFRLLQPRVLYRPRHLSEDDIRAGNAKGDNPYVEKYLQINKRYNEPIAPQDDPFRSENNGGVVIQQFAPKSCPRENLNNHSLVTVINHARLKIIIPGDNESLSWDELLASAVFIEAIKGTDILLASHHGREAGFSSKLFDYISPYLTIVSDGAETDTSATDRYSKKSRGWKVNRRNGEKVERKCVTTRNDGVVVVDLGENPDGSAYMSVKID